MLTRALDHIGDEAALLRRLGATVDVVPLIRIGPPPNESALDQAVKALDDFDWLVFTSRSAVEAFSRLARPLPHALRLAAVGPVTAAAVRVATGRAADLIPGNFDANTLATALIRTAEPRARILILQAELARPELAARLRAEGFDVVACSAYSTIEQAPADLRERIAAADAIVLASASAARSLAGALGKNAGGTLDGKVVACIGKITAREARGHRLPVDVMPKQATMAALVDALEARFAALESAGS